MSAAVDCPVCQGKVCEVESGSRDAERAALAAIAEAEVGRDGDMAVLRVTPSALNIIARALGPTSKAPVPPPPGDYTHGDVWEAWNASLKGKVIENGIGDAFDSYAFRAFSKALAEAARKRRNER